MQTPRLPHRGINFMKRFLITTCLLLLMLVSFAQKREALLYKAYKANSLNQLDSFFNHWLSETAPISTAAFNTLSDTVQNIYAVFQNFYNPIDIDKTGGSEWGNDIYAKVKYLVVQTDIRYGFVDTLDKDLLIKNKINRYTKGDSSKLQSLLQRYNGDIENLNNNFLDWPEAKTYYTLNNFRPKLSFTKPGAVMLTPEYENLLNQFLGSSHYKLGTGNIMAPATSKGESEKRQRFLEGRIKIWYGHWGGYWQLLSYPSVEKITFDTKFENALVDYRLVYEGGYAYFKKINGNWTLVHAKRTWIE